MKIYFAGSIRAGRGDKATYLRLIDHLRRFGPVLTEHVGDSNLTADGDDGVSDEAIYQRDMAWLREADAVVAEVSTPSLGVGYEIGVAEAQGKPILCLYRNGSGNRLSAMLSGNPRLRVASYQALEEACGEMERFLGNVAARAGAGAANP